MGTSLSKTKGAVKAADTVYNIFSSIVKSAGSVGHWLHNVEIGAAKIVGTNVTNAISGFKTVPTSIYGNTASGTATKTIAQNILDPVPHPKGKGGDNGGGKKLNPLTPSNNTSANIKFNLPPHLWSLPVDQSLFNSGKTLFVDPALRRARMWCYVGADNSSYSTVTGAGSASTSSTANTAAAKLDTQWGFQFLWNPTQIGTAVQRNANLVPQAIDAFASRAPLFPGTESLSFVAVIDRVNDFACFKSAPDQASYHTEFYGKNAGVAANTSALIIDLMTKGTMADIEYIFKMINGDGINGVTWKNALGRKTADLNFLAPTPVAVQFGPNADSLSYVGWVESLSISHQMFTEDMIPIHSEVIINMSTYSQSSFSNG